eukprot:4152963-Pleurochrysis_carterae.AAC.5
MRTCASTGSEGGAGAAVSVTTGSSGFAIVAALDPPSFADAFFGAAFFVAPDAVPFFVGDVVAAGLALGLDLVGDAAFEAAGGFTAFTGRIDAPTTPPRSTAVGLGAAAVFALGLVPFVGDLAGGGIAHASIHDRQQSKLEAVFVGVPKPLEWAELRCTA